MKGVLKMDYFKDVSTDELESMVKERREEIREMLCFITEIVKKIGKVTKRETLSSNTKMERMVDSFGGLFAFLWSTGETMMGGNTIKAWMGKNIDSMWSSSDLIFSASARDCSSSP